MANEIDHASASLLLTMLSASDPGQTKDRLTELMKLTEKFEKEREKADAAIREMNAKRVEHDRREGQMEKQEEELAQRLTDVVNREGILIEAEKRLQVESARRLAEWQDQKLAVARMESEATKRAQQVALDTSQSQHLRALWQKKHDLIKQAEALG